MVEEEKKCVFISGEACGASVISMCDMCLSFPACPLSVVLVWSAILHHTRKTIATALLKL